METKNNNGNKSNTIKEIIEMAKDYDKIPGIMQTINYSKKTH